eukprot:scaffold79805_cov17-Tisochrysis_lutea.AAC.2
MALEDGGPHLEVGAVQRECPHDGALDRQQQHAMDRGLARVALQEFLALAVAAQAPLPCVAVGGVGLQRAASCVTVLRVLAPLPVAYGDVGLQVPLLVADGGVGLQRAAS